MIYQIIHGKFMGIPVKEKICCVFIFGLLRIIALMRPEASAARLCGNGYFRPPVLAAGKRLAFSCLQAEKIMCLVVKIMWLAFYIMWLAFLP